MTFVISSVKVQIRFSFFAVTAAMLFCARHEIVIICLLSSLFHECGHLFFLALFGERPERIVFAQFGIRIDRQQSVSLDYKKEAVIALGGIAMNFLLCVFFTAVYFICKNELLLYGVFSNILIAALNMMPIDMLDCGNFLRYMLLMRYDEQKTEKVLKRVSDITALVMTALFVVYTICFSFNLSFAAVEIYVIITSRH